MIFLTGCILNLLIKKSVIEICKSENIEKLLGVIVQLGGQTPLKLSEDLSKSGIKFLEHLLNPLIYVKIEIVFQN